MKMFHKATFKWTRSYYPLNLHTGLATFKYYVLFHNAHGIVPPLPFFLFHSSWEIERGHSGAIRGMTCIVCGRPWVPHTSSRPPWTTLTHGNICHSAKPTFVGTCLLLRRIQQFVRIYCLFERKSVLINSSDNMTRRLMFNCTAIKINKKCITWILLSHKYLLINTVTLDENISTKINTYNKNWKSESETNFIKKYVFFDQELFAKKIVFAWMNK